MSKSRLTSKVFILLRYNSLICGTECYLGWPQTSGLRPRKIDAQYWPDAFNTEGEPCSEILRDFLLFIGCHIVLKCLIIAPQKYFGCILWIYVLLDV